MLTTFAVLGVLVALFLAAALATMDSQALAPAPRDAADLALPEGPVGPEEVRALRFGLALRGYRMSEVDRALERLATDLAERDVRIEELRRAVGPVATPLRAQGDALVDLAKPVAPGSDGEQPAGAGGLPFVPGWVPPGSTAPDAPLPPDAPLLPDAPTAPAEGPTDAVQTDAVQTDDTADHTVDGTAPTSATDAAFGAADALAFPEVGLPDHDEPAAAERGADVEPGPDPDAPVPTSEEPTADGPTDTGPPTDEPAADEPSFHEPSADDSTADDSTADVPPPAPGFSVGRVPSEPVDPPDRDR